MPGTLADNNDDVPVIQPGEVLRFKKDGSGYEGVKVWDAEFGVPKDGEFAHWVEANQRWEGIDANGVRQALGLTAQPPGKHFVLFYLDDIGITYFKQYWEENAYPGVTGPDDNPNNLFCNLPWIDFLAQRGITFKRAYNTPVCSPGRAQALTGMHNHWLRLGTVVKEQNTDADGVGGAATTVEYGETGAAYYTIPQVLRTQAGVKTIIKGKVHLSLPRGSDTVPASGFSGTGYEIAGDHLDGDVNRGLGFETINVALRNLNQTPSPAHQSVGDFYNWVEYKNTGSASDYSESLVSSRETTYNGGGEWDTGNNYVSTPTASRVSIHGRTYECILNHTSAASNEPGVGANWETVWLDVGEDGYATKIQMGGAADLLNSSTDPTFMYVPVSTNHSPFQRVRDETLVNTAEYLAQVSPGVESIWPLAMGMVEAFDYALGQFISKLDPTTLAETTIMVMGDNGTDSVVMESCRNAPTDPTPGPGKNLGADWESILTRDGGSLKGSMYQQGISVPCFFSGPDVVNKGSVAYSLIDSTDIFPTVLEYFGLDPADYPASGSSRMPIIRGNDDFMNDSKQLALSRIFKPNGLPSNIQPESTNWATGTSYAANQSVYHEGANFQAKSAHTSSATTEPRAGDTWSSVWTLTGRKTNAWLFYANSATSGSALPQHTGLFKIIRFLGSRADEMYQISNESGAVVDFKELSPLDFTVAGPLQSIYLYGISVFQVPLSGAGQPRPADQLWSALNVS